MSLENAPDEVKLAVDLIVLLEENQVAPETVLKALEIVKRDYEKKQLSSSKNALWLKCLKALHLSGLRMNRSSQA